MPLECRASGVTSNCRLHDATNAYLSKYHGTTMEAARGWCSWSWTSNTWTSTSDIPENVCWTVWHPARERLRTMYLVGSNLQCRPVCSGQVPQYGSVQSREETPHYQLSVLRPMLLAPTGCRSTREGARRLPSMKTRASGKRSRIPLALDDSEKVKQSGAVSLGSDPDRNVATFFSKRRLQGASDGALARGC